MNDPSDVMLGLPPGSVTELDLDRVRRRASTRRRWRRGSVVGASLCVVVLAVALVSSWASDTSVKTGPVLSGSGVAPSPLFGDVEQLTPTSLPAGWARCGGGHPKGTGSDGLSWSQTFGPTEDGSCEALITITQIPPGGDFPLPSTAEDGKLGEADVSQWSDPERGSEGLLTWAFDQNLVVEACCGPTATEHVRDLATAALDGTRQRPRADCTRPDADLDAEDLITNLTSKTRRVTDANGCLIRTDIASMETLPATAHCYAGLSFATIGTPFGSSIASTSARTYVRDPDGDLAPGGAQGEFDPDAQLPATATNTGFSSDGQSIWIDSADDAVLYVVRSDHVEAWPRLTQPLGCM